MKVYKLCDEYVNYAIYCVLIFKDHQISFYSQNTNMLLHKLKISYRYLKSGMEEFHRKYVLVPADKATNNVVVV